MSLVRKRIRELRERLQGELQRQQAEKGQLWLQGLPDDDLVRLAERQKAVREFTGDPERLLTLEEMADTLGKSREAVEGEIRAAGGAS